MGNCVSAPEDVIISPRIRVVQAAEGRVVEVDVPDLQSMSMKVAELLLEFSPGHFVAQFDQADFCGDNSKRASPLAADADVKPGLLYVLFPMPRLHTRITPQELLALGKLLHLHHQLAKGDRFPSKGAALKPQCRRLFTGRGVRVAPYVLAQEDGCNIYSATASDVGHASNAMADSVLQQSIIFCPNSSLLGSQLHSQMAQMQVIKSRPWAPKLETIKESV